MVATIQGLRKDFRAFAHAWIEAWNAHDLDAILDHYCADISLRSPFARLLTGDGSILGREALRSYWSEALERRPELQFELLQAFAGDDAVTLFYRDEQGRSGAETMIFSPAGQIVISCACYDR